MLVLRKTSGYTHRITYRENHSSYGHVERTFRTTQDALKFHLAAMQRSGLCYDINVEQIKG